MLKIEGLNINENTIEEIIEDENVKVCDINLNIIEFFSNFVKFCIFLQIL